MTAHTSNTDAQVNGRDGPFGRQTLHTLPQYTARQDFPSFVTWKKIRGLDTLLVNTDGTDGHIEVAVPVIVGRVTSDKVYLEPQGTFNANYKDPAKNLKNAKLAFTIVNPVGDPDYGVDFGTSIENLQAVQRLAAETPLHQHLLIPDGSGSFGVRMNFPLWEKKTDLNKSTDTDIFTKRYKVNHESQTWFHDMKTSSYIRQLPLYDNKDDLITDPDTFEDQLVGALVEVHFTLKHYYIAATDRDGIQTEANDTFTASIDEITILKKPPPVVKSPHRSILSPKKKPRRKPQQSLASASRVEQVAAAQSFMPLGSDQAPVYDESGKAIASQPQASSSSSVSSTTASETA